MKLAAATSSASDPDSDTARHHIQVYSVSASNTVTGGAIFANLTNGVPDGIRCDVDGRVWSSGGDGLYIFAATDGHLIGKIKFLRVVNLCWGGPQYKTLYMVGQPIVTSIRVLVAGTPSLKKLQSTFNGSQLKLSWPAPSTGFALLQTEQLISPINWTASPLAVAATNGQNVMTVDATSAAIYFRLRLN